MNLNLNILSGRLYSRFRSPLIKSMAIVASITLFLKMVAFYKETIIASTFGLSEVLDTFFIAVLLPTFVQSVFLSSLKNLFIPNYIAEIKNNGNTSSFQSLVFLMTILISIASITFVYFFIDIFLNLIYPGHKESYYNLVRKQLFVILPSLILWGLSSVISGILELKNRYFTATIYQFFPLLTMLFFLFYLHDYYGNMVLAYGTLFGSSIGFIYLLFISIKHGYLSFSKPVINKNSKMMIRQLPAKISSSFLSSMNNFIDQFFVGQLAVGSIAALNYGNRIPAFGVSIVIMALGSVLLPYFSRIVSEDINAAYNKLFQILKLVLIIGIIGVIITILLSDIIVELWLERKEFTHEDTIIVSNIQKILLVNVPFYLCTLIIVRFLTSINKNMFMAKISFLNLLVNVVLNFIFIKYFGVFGLALSTSIVLIVSSGFYFGYTYKQYKKLL